MAKLTLIDIANLQNEQTVVAQINANNALVETVMDTALFRDGETPNSMEADLDMNSNRILNLVEAEDNTEPVRKQEFDEALQDLVLGEIPESALDPWLATKIATEAEAIAGVSNIKLMTPLRTKQSRPENIVNAIFDFGATGDGTTDDTTALQNAINYGLANGVPVFIPAGEYVITSPLTVVNDTYEQKNGPVVYGDREKTIIKPSGAFATSFIRFRGCPQAFLISSITEAANGEVTTSEMHDFVTGDQIIIHDATGMDELNVSAVNPNPYTITVTGNSSFTLGVDTSAMGAYTGGGYAVKLATTYFRGGGVSNLTIDGSNASLNVNFGALEIAAWLHGTFENLYIINTEGHGVLLKADDNYTSSTNPYIADWSANNWCVFNNCWIAEVGGKGFYDFHELGSIGTEFNRIQTFRTGGEGLLLQSTNMKVLNSGVAYAGVSFDGSIHTQVPGTYGILIGSSAGSSIQGITIENVEFESCVGGSVGVFRANQLTVRNTRNNHSSALNASASIDILIWTLNVAGTFCTTTANHGLTAGQLVRVSDVVGPSELENQTGQRMFLIDTPSANSIEFLDIRGNSIDSSGWAAVTSNGSVQRVLSLPGDGNAFYDICIGGTGAVSNSKFENMNFRVSDIVTSLIGVRNTAPANCTNVHVSGLSYQGSSFSNTPFACDFRLQSGAETSNNNYLQDVSVEASSPYPQVLVEGRSKKSGLSFHAHKNGTDQTGILVATLTDVTFSNRTSSPGFDPAGRFFLAGSAFVPTPGVYKLTAQATFNTTNVTDGSLARINIVNKSTGAVMAEARFPVSAAAQDVTPTVSTNVLATVDTQLCGTMSAANPVRVTTTAAHGLTDGDIVWFENIEGGHTSLNFNPGSINFYFVNQIDATTFDLYTDAALSVGVDGSAFSVYGGGGLVFIPDTYGVQVFMSAGGGNLELDGEATKTFFTGSSI